jgi:replicative DNA helicase
MNVHAQPIDVHKQDRFDTEAALIGGILASQDANLYRAAAAICEGDHFIDPFNARMFGLIGQGVDGGLKAFPLAAFVMAQLRDDPTLKEIGITASGTIAKYVTLACPPIGVEGCARQIKYDYLNDFLKTAVENGKTAAAESFAAEMERLSRAHLDKNEGVTSASKASTEIVERLADLHQNGRQAPDFVYPGSWDLSRVIKGWRRGRFYVIAGRPGMGKSTAALSLLVHTAKQGAGVLFFSLEMTNAELMEMALCDLAWSRFHRIEYRDLSEPMKDTAESEKRFERIREAGETLADYPLTIMDRGGMTIAEMRSQALMQAQRLQAQGKRLEVIAIDHLGLIKPSGKYAGNKVAETEEISAALKALAKELNVAVIALVQLNRGVEGREDKRPSLSDLRWSGAIEQDSDVVMFVYREAYYLTKPVSDPIEEIARMDKLQAAKNELEVIFAKHRGGPCPTIKMFCDMGCGVVRDLEANR